MHKIFFKFVVFFVLQTAAVAQGWEFHRNRGDIRAGGCSKPVGDAQACLIVRCGAGGVRQLKLALIEGGLIPDTGTIIIGASRFPMRTQHGADASEVVLIGNVPGALAAMHSNGALVLAGFDIHGGHDRISLKNAGVSLSRLDAACGGSSSAGQGVDPCARAENETKRQLGKINVLKARMEAESNANALDAICKYSKASLPVWNAMLRPYSACKTNEARQLENKIRERIVESQGNVAQFNCK